MVRGVSAGHARRYDARMNILGIRSTAAARAALLAALLAAVLALAGCGGGLWIGIGDGFDDDPPVVSLTASTTSAPAGASITLLAAAADDDGIDGVEFYRLEAGGGAQRLGSDLQSPYELTVVVPTDGRAVLHVFARAYDFDGNAADSEMLAITITP